jgi:hypothetical protein
LATFYQEKGRSPSSGGELGQDYAKGKNSERIKIASYLAMTAVLKIQIWLPFYQETCEASLKAYKNINSTEKR